MWPVSGWLRAGIVRSGLQLSSRRPQSAGAGCLAGRFGEKSRTPSGNPTWLWRIRRWSIYFSNFPFRWVSAMFDIVWLLEWPVFSPAQMAWTSQATVDMEQKSFAELVACYKWSNRGPGLAKQVQSFWPTNNQGFFPALQEIEISLDRGNPIGCRKWSRTVVVDHCI